MKLIRVGVDLAKNVFQVHGVDRNEKATFNLLADGRAALLAARLCPAQG